MIKTFNNNILINVKIFTYRFIKMVLKFVRSIEYDESPSALTSDD